MAQGIRDLEAGGFEGRVYRGDQRGKDLSRHEGQYLFYGIQCWQIRVDHRTDPGSYLVSLLTIVTKARREMNKKHLTPV